MNEACDGPAPASLPPSHLLSSMVVSLVPEFRVWSVEFRSESTPMGMELVGVWFPPPPSLPGWVAVGPRLDGG